MSRYGLNSLVCLTVLLTGCQTAWRNDADLTEISGLEQPDSLIRFPSAVADYRESEKAATVETARRQPSGIKQASAEVESGGSMFDGFGSATPVAGLEAVLANADRTLKKFGEAAPDQQPVILAQSKRYYLEYLQGYPNDAHANHRMGVISDLEENFEAAETYYRRAIAVTPHDADLMSNIGYSYQLQDRPAVAKQFLERALLIDPQHARAASNLGQIFAGQGDYDNAFAMFRRSTSETEAAELMAYFFPEGKPTPPAIPAPIEATPDAPRVLIAEEVTNEFPVAGETTGNGFVEGQLRTAQEAISAADQRIAAAFDETSQFESPTTQSRQSSVPMLPMIRPRGAKAAPSPAPQPQSGISARERAAAMVESLKPPNSQTASSQPAPASAQANSWPQNFEMLQNPTPLERQPMPTPGPQPGNTAPQANASPWAALRVAPTYRLERPRPSERPVFAEPADRSELQQSQPLNTQPAPATSTVPALGPITMPAPTAAVQPPSSSLLQSQPISLPPAQSLPVGAVRGSSVPAQYPGAMIIDEATGRPAPSAIRVQPTPAATPARTASPTPVGGATGAAGPLQYESLSKPDSLPVIRKSLPLPKISAGK